MAALDHADAKAATRDPWPLERRRSDAVFRRSRDVAPHGRTRPGAAGGRSRGRGSSEPTACSSTPTGRAGEYTTPLPRVSVKLLATPRRAERAGVGQRSADRGASIEGQAQPEMADFYRASESDATENRAGAGPSEHQFCTGGEHSVFAQRQDRLLGDDAGVLEEGGWRCATRVRAIPKPAVYLRRRCASAPIRSPSCQQSRKPSVCPGWTGCRRWSMGRSSSRSQPDRNPSQRTSARG
jgi:hypothetical protein